MLLSRLLCIASCMLHALMRLHVTCQQEEQEKRRERADRFNIPDDPSIDYKPEEDIAIKTARAHKFGVEYKPEDAVLMDMGRLELLYDCWLSAYSNVILCLVDPGFQIYLRRDTRLSTSWNDGAMLSTYMVGIIHTGGTHLRLALP